MTPPVVVGFILCAIAAGVFTSLWWSADSDLRAHAERLAVIEAAVNLGGEPLSIADPCATEPMPQVHITDAPTAVAAAREANRERPTPFPRKGRHSA
jgi:hypothetical protein